MQRARIRNVRTMVSESGLSLRQQFCLQAMGLPLFSRRIVLPGARPDAPWQVQGLPAVQILPAAKRPVDAPPPPPPVTPPSKLPEPPRVVAAVRGFALRMVVTATPWLVLLSLRPGRDLDVREERLLRNILSFLGEDAAEPGPLFSFPPPGSQLWQQDAASAVDAMAGLLLRHSPDQQRLLILGRDLQAYLPPSWQAAAVVADDLGELLADAAAKRRLWREVDACCS